MKLPARPGAPGQTVASDPQALAGNVGSDPGKVRKALYEPEFQISKALDCQCPHLSVTQQGSVYLYWPCGPITQSTNGMALYLLADLPQGVDLSWPGISFHKSGHHLVHPVNTCSRAARGA